ncbi:MAG: adenylate/guanylate cyclase domain-containing protein [Flavobacteriales bacterium]
MKYLLFSLLLLSSFGCSAQLRGQARLDSLLAQLPDMKEDTMGVRLLRLISSTYALIDPQQGVIYGKRAVALGTRLGDIRYTGSAFSDLARNQMILGDFPAAYANFLEALKRYEAAGLKSNAAGAMLNIGIVFMRQKDLLKAREYYLKAEPLALELDNKPMLMAIYENVAGTYNEDDTTHAALDYVTKALKVAEATKDSAAIGHVLGNLASVYLDTHRLQEALNYQHMSLAISKARGLERSTAYNLTILGAIHMELAKDTAGHSPQAITKNRMDHAKLAIAYLREAVSMNEKLKIPHGLMEANRYLHEAYALHDDHRSAWMAHKRYTELKDSIFSSENSQAITNLETKRMVELKEKDIEIARLEVEKKRNERWFFIAGIVLLLVIMGTLFRSFRKQRQANVVISLEKKRSDDLLLNILPAEVAAELMDTGAAEAKHFDSATILFTDFKGFTEASEKLSPQELVEELNTCFKAFDQIITLRGIEKIKTIGDAYMCAGGLPDPKTSSPADVVHAALEMQSFMIARKIERDSQGLPAFEMRVGIHTGPVVAGIVGVKKFQYDIWGDTVNTASRMESSGEVGQVNISEATYALVKLHSPALAWDTVLGEDGVASTHRVDPNSAGQPGARSRPAFTFTPRGKVQAKGKGEMEMYFVSMNV